MLLLDVFFHLLRMCTTVDKDLFDSGICEELKGVFYERRVCEGEEALRCD